MPPTDAKSFDEWRAMTQAYQAALLQLQIEDLRRLKYSPTGGFAMFSLADPQPLASWSVLDHDREPERGYFAVRDACRPVLAMVEPRAGLVHVVNDTREDLFAIEVEASADGRVTRWIGDVAGRRLGVRRPHRSRLTPSTSKSCSTHPRCGPRRQPLPAPRAARRLTRPRRRLPVSHSDVVG